MGLNGLDVAVIVVYLACVTLFGMRFRKQTGTLKGYFLAEKTIPWWAISLSIVAAETSTLTIISVPGMAYERDFGFLQLVIGYLVGRVIISVLLIPHYFRGELVTAYQLIERRFGQKLRALTAGLFLITRAAAEGVRVFAVAIVVGIALSGILGGLGDFARDVAAIGIVSILTLIYTFEGGMAAVIWTDVVQLAVYVTGTLVGFFTILHLVPGGWHTVHGMASEAGKFRVFYWRWNFYQSYTFWSGLIGGAFLTTASHGTDQLIVQRLLSSRSERQAKLALLASGVMVLFQFSLFLLVGAMLFVFYRLFPPGVAFTRSDTIYPTFIVTRMPHGVSGLLISAILAAAMANLSAALNSLSSTTIVDFYSRLESAGERAAPGIFVAAGDGGLGSGAVRAGDCGAARREGAGGGTVDCLGGLRVAAGSFYAGGADAARHRGGSDGGNALRLWAECVPVAVHAGSLHLVCGAGERGDIRGGLWREFLCGTKGSGSGDGSGDDRWRMSWTG